jgi:V-type H+-transporting ATPase subunit H
LGEFARFHPYGKTILEKLGAKEKAMELLNDRNRAIREAALLCTQKIMIHQWQRINF